ncbi:RNA polymerase sigma factor [Ureibacillus manganicus]|nr:sigma factor [Ureibacillus manganicus]
MQKLYLEHNRTIYKYIFYLVQDEQLAEDLMQDTFLKAYKNLHDFRR